MTTTKPPADYGPIQLARRLDLATWQFDRARHLELIPRPDLPGGHRWSATVADVVAADLDRIRAEVGNQPDVGAHRAAEILSERFGVEVDPGILLELDQQGLIEATGDYKGHTLYDGRALERFTDQDALELAISRGRLLLTDQAAAHLRIRPADLAHLVRAGLLTPTTRVRSIYQRQFEGRRSQPRVALYRVGDLDELATRTDVEWDTIRATQPGRRSPLAALPTATRRR